MHGKGRHADSDISSTGLYAAVAVAALGGAAVHAAVEKYRGLMMDDDYLLDKAYMDLSHAYPRANEDARNTFKAKIKHWLSTDVGLDHHIKNDAAGAHDNVTYVGTEDVRPPRSAIGHPPADGAAGADVDGDAAAAGDADYGVATAAAAGAIAT
jgi:hypothetical protein